MLPWYAQIAVLVGVAVVLYPIIVVVYLRYFFLNSLCESVLNECFKMEKQKKEEQELPRDENPLETGDCTVVMGNIIRKDDESKFEW